MRQPFPSSTALTSMDYDPSTRTLTVTFRSGRSYTYNDVPEDVAQQFAQADSPGQFWRSEIKDVYG